MWVHIAQCACYMHITRVRGLDRGQNKGPTESFHTTHATSLFTPRTQASLHHTRSLVYSHQRALHKANRKESKSVATLR